MIVLILSTRNTHKVDEIKSVLSNRFSYLSLTDFANSPRTVEDAVSFRGNALKKSSELARWVAAEPAQLSRVLNALNASQRGAQTGDAEDIEPAPSSPPQPLHRGVPDSVVTPDMYCLADDSGLEVDALGGAPGVMSARFASPEGSTSGNSSDAANNQKLLRLLQSVPPEQRTARFRCAIAVTPVLLLHASNASPVCHAEEAELHTRVFEGTCEGRVIDAPRGAHGFGYDPLFVPDGYQQTFAELGEHTKNQISHRARALGQVLRWLESVNRS